MRTFIFALVLSIALPCFGQIQQVRMVGGQGDLTLPTPIQIVPATNDVANLNNYFLLVPCPSTNQVYQLTNATTYARFVSFVGYSNRLINTSTAWVMTHNATNGPGIPLAAGGLVNFSAPTGQRVDLTNFWFQSATANDAIGVIWSY